MNAEFLIQALNLAATRRGFCAPNPAVGTVVVKNNKILAQGYHQGCGQPHAEVEALKNLGGEATGAALYVTLEPCCHFGKTPPCTDLVIKRGIKQVIYGFKDPNPQVAEKSEKILENAGVEVFYMQLKEIDEFYRSYAFWWKNKKPFVTAKLAMSLDGKIAGVNGARMNITGEAAQLFTHEQRKITDAILTTAKTIINDNPLLNVRLSGESWAKPVYVLDSQLCMPLNSAIFNSAKSITVFHSEKVTKEKIMQFEKNRARCIAVSSNEYGLNLAEILQVIGKDGMHDLWLEAGGHCFAAFLKQNLLQKAFIYMAPKWLGAATQSAFDEENDIFNSGKAKKWRVLGEDAVCEMYWLTKDR